MEHILIFCGVVIAMFVLYKIGYIVGNVIGNIIGKILSIFL